RDEVRKTYRLKEVEFPVRGAIGHFIPDRAQGGSGEITNREGLRKWAEDRFPGETRDIDFDTLPPKELETRLIEISRRSFPARDPEALDAEFTKAFGAALEQPQSPREFLRWAWTELAGWADRQPVPRLKDQVQEKVLEWAEARLGLQ